MKLQTLSALILLCANIAHGAVINISFDHQRPDTLLVRCVAIADLATDHTYPTIDTVAVTSPKISLPYKITQPYRFTISPMYQDYNSATLYIAPTDTIDIAVERRDLSKARISGTDLMNSINAYRHTVSDLSNRITDSIADSGEWIMAQYRFNYDYTLAHRNDPVAIESLGCMPVAMAESIIDSIGLQARQSILQPIYRRITSNVEKFRMTKVAQQATSVGATAPDFTLADANGNPVSLSQFRGQWVLIDFWGTWCGWCIKGFPALREFQSRYADKCTVIGVACHDAKDSWMGFINAHRLPWINLWNDPESHGDSNVERIYGLESYPTKLLIDPQGKIMLKVIGENPDFYNKAETIIDFNL